MNVNLKNPVLIAAVIALVVVVAFALGPSLVESAQCHRTSAGGDSQSSPGCAAMGPADGCGMGKNMMGCPGNCAPLSGKITGVDTKNGTVAVRLTAGAKAGAAVKNAIGKAKVGDEIAVMVMLTKDGKLASRRPHDGAAMAAYICPVHPDQTSGKSGKCSICAMNLVSREEMSE